MQIIRNKAKKVICEADAKEKSVEILKKGIKTRISFKEDGTLKISNTKTT